MQWLTIRHALRRVLAARGFSITIVLMLALGIALSTIMVGVLRGVLGSLAFPQADQVVVVEGNSAELGIQNGSLTPAEAIALTRDDTPFAQFGFYDWNGITVLKDQRPREITVIRVSSGFFDALGVKPALGRWFNQTDFDSGDSVILSHSEWQRLFAADPAAVGRRIETTDGTLVVAGVMPAGFNTPSEDAGAWRVMPRDAFPLDQPWTWHARYLSAVARLDPAVSPASLSERLDRIATAVASRHNLSPGQWQIRTRAMLEVMVGELRGVLWGAFAIALLVLLIACANVAILVDARQVARSHQQALTQALGASRRRLYGDVLVEIGLLTCLGIGLGVALAVFGIDALRELARSSLPRVDEIKVDLAVLAAAIVLGLVVPLFAGLAGALKPRGSALEAMRGGGRGLIGFTKRRTWLPAIGVALSTVSLIAGSALIFSLWRLQELELGLAHQNVYAIQLFHEQAPAQRRMFSEQMRERLLALPSVRQVAVANAAPLSQMGSISIDVKLPGREQPEPYQLGLRRVSNQFSDVLRVPLLKGRGFDHSDGIGADKVALINQVLARRLFGATDPLGKLLQLPLGDGPRVDYRVVGVVGDIRNQGLRSAAGPEIWVPFEQAPSVGMTFLVATHQPISEYERIFADALYEIDPKEAATLMFPLSESFESALAPTRFFARTVSAFAVAALLLAAFGVYAVAALRQQQRVGEFGLRLAVGAKPSALLRQMLRESMWPVLGGVVFGSGAALAVLRLLQSQLFGLESARLSVAASGILVLLTAALFAALVPAWRAARTQPMEALRQV